MKLLNHLSMFSVLTSIFITILGMASLSWDMHSKYEYYIFFLCLQLIVGFLTTCVNIPLGAYFRVHVPL